MRVRRGDLLDVLVADDRAAVFAHGQVVVLTEIATTILLATPAHGSAALEELTAAVVAQFGPPEPPADANDLTRQQVLDLVAHALLELEKPPPD